MQTPPRRRAPPDARAQPRMATGLQGKTSAAARPLLQRVESASAHCADRDRAPTPRVDRRPRAATAAPAPLAVATPLQSESRSAQPRPDRPPGPKPDRPLEPVPNG